MKVVEDTSEAQQNILSKLQSTIKKKVVGKLTRTETADSVSSPIKTAGERAASSFGLNLQGLLASGLKKNNLNQS